MSLAYITESVIKNKIYIYSDCILTSFGDGIWTHCMCTRPLYNLANDTKPLYNLANGTITSNIVEAWSTLSTDENPNAFLEYFCGYNNYPINLQLRIPNLKTWTNCLRKTARINCIDIKHISRVHWKPRVTMVTSLSSLVALEVVDMTTSGGATEDKVGVMTASCSWCIKRQIKRPITISAKYIIATSIRKLNSMNSNWSHPWDEL